MANGKHYCNSSPLHCWKPCLLWVNELKGQLFEMGWYMTLERRENVSHNDAVSFRVKLKLNTMFGKAFTGLKLLFARAATTVISSISPPLHFQTFPSYSNWQPYLLWPYWACANTAQGNSTKRQHLLWVYPTERTEKRLHLFFLLCVFCYIFIILLCCWVAFKNNQYLYLFRKLDWFCE